MKKLLTNNVGLKILSVLAAVIIWIIVVNIDDPVIYKTFSGIPVEITNTELLTNDGKTYEIPEGSGTVSVTVQAQRSVMENMTKDYIKAYADMRNITVMDTVPIEYKSTRYSDRISSISSRTNTIPVIIENKKSKQIRIAVSTEGEVTDGYIVGDINPSVSVITVSGPESVVDTVKEASVSVNVGAMTESFKSSCAVQILDLDGRKIENRMLNVSKSEITTEVEILETKEIPVTAAFTGTPAAGFSATGIVVCDPSSIVIAGKGSAYENLTSINIPAADINIDGCNDNASMKVKIKDYLPKDIVLASDTSDIDVVVLVEAHSTKEISVPADNISVINVPDGYMAHIVSVEDVLTFEVSGLESDLDGLTALSYTAVIDADDLVPRVADDDETEAEPIHTGANDGSVILNLPPDIIQNTQMTLEVIITQIGVVD